MRIFDQSMSQYPLLHKSICEKVHRHHSKVERKSLICAPLEDDEPVCFQKALSSPTTIECIAI